MGDMGATFIPSRCAHIDTVGSNVLIRGNMPLLGADLHYALNEIKEASGVKDLFQRRLIDIPIIDNVGERKQFEAILKAFSVDPNKFPESFWPWWNQKSYAENTIHGKTLTTEGLSQPGGLIWRPFEGLPKDENPKQFLGAPGWDYVGFVNLVIKLMKTMKNCAFYVHCQLGADRTGAFHIGYLMKTNGISLQEASVAANGSTSAGAPNADYKRLVAAYAETL